MLRPSALVLGIAALAAGAGIVALGTTATYLSSEVILAALAGSVLIGLGIIVLIEAAQTVPPIRLKAPSRLRLVRSEPWRRTTSLRYVERLKERLLCAEKGLLRAHDICYQAYLRLLDSTNRLEQREWLRRKTKAEGERQHLEGVVVSLKQRIERIHAGEAGAEILHITESIKKLQRDRLELQRNLDALRPCNHNTQQAADACPFPTSRQADLIRESLYSIDLRIIEMETHLEELSSYEFGKLWRSLQRPEVARSGLAAISRGHLDDLREKSRALQRVPLLIPAAATPRPSLSPEEQRALQKMKLQQKLRELAAEEAEALRESPNEAEARRFQNIYANRRQQIREELEKYL